MEGFYKGKPFMPGKEPTLDRWVNEWSNHVYPSDLKEILIKYENKNEIGNTVLDLGSGPKPLAFNLSTPKKIILLDIVPMVCSLKKEGIETISVWADLDKLIDTENYKSIAEYGKVDTVIASSIFNYVDWKKLISLQTDFHKKGGHIFIANLLEDGVKRLFSKKRPKYHLEIEETLPKYGYKVIEQSIEDKLKIIVARKN